MRARALEIRWHDTQPIFSADFQPFPCTDHVRQMNPYERQAQGIEHDDTSWRLATAGGDNKVRIWLVTPSPATPLASTSTAKAPATTAASEQPRVAYLATLAKHDGVANVVRWSPDGQTLASAGDDGIVCLWRHRPGQAAKAVFGEDPDEPLDREVWTAGKVLRSIQGDRREIYDLAWSPDGKYIIVGSTDQMATVWNTLDGSVVTRLVDHSHYVQGVSWDPLGEFVATQSSDRHMHVYSVRPDDAHGLRLAHAGKLSKLGHRPTTGWANVPLDPPPPPAHEIPAETFRRPAPRRSASHAPSDSDRSETSHAAASSATDAAAHAPAASGSAPTTPALLAVTSAAAMNPPAELPTKSRRSSVSNAGSPALLPRAARSPSPAAPLPAVRMPTSPRASPLSLPPSADLPALTTHVLYGDAAISPFFRRLTWSTDGQLLLTPAGIYEDPTVIVPTNGAAPAPAKPEKKAKKGKDDKPRPTVYVYTRQNVTSAPSMGLRGHSSGSIVIRFSPILYELRPGVKINGRLPPPRAGTTDEGSGSKKRKRTEPIELTPGTSRTVKLPSPDAPNPTGAGPAVPVDDGATAMEPTSTGEAGEQAPVEGTASVIDLPHRMIYAVATHETVYIYDTQQTEQICTFGNLHYAPFTDVSWTADGNGLCLSSQDGYCSIVAFDEGELGTPLPPERQVRQPVQPQPQSAPAPVPGPSTAPAPSTSAPVASTSSSAPIDVDAQPSSEAPAGEPSSKKRRVALTLEGPLDA